MEELDVLDMLKVLIIYTIPEGIAIVYCVSVLLEVKIKPILIICLGILTALMPFFLRLLPLKFGIHTIISALLLALLISWIYRCGKVSSFAAVLKVFLVLALIEMSYVNLLIILLDLTPEILYTHPYIVLPQVMVLFFAGMLYQKHKRKRKPDKDV